MKVSELTGAALDWAVAKCEGNTGDFGIDGYSPSTNWAQGGPIIEREAIAIGKGHEQWIAFANSDVVKRIQGPTPLIAAMRCFVASKLGDEVDVPKEMTTASA